MDDKFTKCLRLKIAAQDAHERALVYYWKEDEFSGDSLDEAIERLERAIEEYKQARKG